VSDTFIKDPSASLDYSWDWSLWLAEAGDTIGSATVTVPDGLTAVGAPVYGDTVVTQQVSGGDVDGAYRLVCRVTTVKGLVDERSIYLTIIER
jgi:hypothetical protein